MPKSPQTFAQPPLGKTIPVTFQGPKATDLFTDDVLHITKDPCAPKYVEGKKGDLHPDTEKYPEHRLQVIVPSADGSTALWTYIRVRPPLISFESTNEGQTDTITKSRVKATDTPPELNALRIGAQQEDLADGGDAQLTVTDEPAVFRHSKWTTEIPDLIPIEFRALVPTTTEAATTAGIAGPPVLGPGQMSASSEQLTVFRKREDSTSRDVTALPKTLHDYELDGINAGGSEFGGVFDSARTLSRDPQEVEQGFTITKSSVKDLGNGITLRETKRLGDGSPARLLLTEAGSGFETAPAVVFGAGNSGSDATGTAVLSTVPVVPPDGDAGGVFNLPLENYGEGGVFSFIGARYNGGVWRNPARAGNIAISSAGADSYPVTPQMLAFLVDHQASPPVGLLPRTGGGHYIAFDMGVGRSLKANKIVLRQATSGGNTIQTRLRVEGFNDFVTAYNLGDAPIPQADGEWSQASLINTTGYRYFRIYGLDGQIENLTPPVWPPLTLSEVEFYGELSIVPGIVKQFSFPGDANGVFYDLGARGNGGVWRNPHTNGDIEVAADNFVLGTPDQLVDREPSNIYQDTVANRAYYFDLKPGRKLVCRKIAFQQRTEFGTIPTPVQLQGTNTLDFVTSDWHPLANFNAPTTHDEWVTADATGVTPYQRFRIITSSNTGFKVGEVELYGSLTFPPAVIPPPSFSIESVVITAGGSLYAVPPIVSFEGDGIGAAGTAVLNEEGEVIGVEMTNHGSGYTTASVFFNAVGALGEGAEATSVIDGQVVWVYVDEEGEDYEDPPTVIFGPETGGTDAAGTAVLGFELLSIGLTNPGSGYSYPPDVIIDPSDAAAYSVLSFVLDSITLDNGGSGYTAPPDVVIEAPTGVAGVQATAHAVLTGDVVTSIVIDNPGYGYEYEPDITFTGDGIDAEAYSTLASTGVVSRIVLDWAGTFETFPDITLVGDGIDATAIPNLSSGGRVMRVDLTDSGNNYQAPPSISFDTGGGPGTNAQASAVIEGPVTGFVITDPGQGYASAPVVQIPGDATATAVVTNGEVTEVNLITPGLYPVAPPVIFSPLGGPEAEATIAFPVESISVEDSGSGYAAPPPVEITGDGRSATAFSVLGRKLQRVEMIAAGEGYGPTTFGSVAAPGGNGGATVSVQRSFGIASVNITNPGSDYTSDPQVTALSPAGVDASVALQAYRGLPLLRASMAGGGSGYSTPPAVSIPAPIAGGTTAVGAAVLGYQVLEITMGSMGSGYTTPPSVELRAGAGGGGGATAVAELLGRTIATILLDNGGSGYLTPPTIVIGDGSNAQAHAVLTGDVVTSIVIDDFGSGYLAVPNIVIGTDGGGTGAHAIATLSAAQDMRIVLTNPGIGYEVAPDVLITLGGGTGATATTALKPTGSVKRVELSDLGTGYSTDVLITLTGDGTGASAFGVRNPNGAGPIVAISVVRPGYGYIATTINCVITGGGGTDAAATAIKATLGNIRSVTVTAQGNGTFEAPPVINIQEGLGGTGTGAVVRAILQPTGKVLRVTMTSGGNGYLTPPTISFPASDGSGAEATAHLSDTGSILSLTLTVPGGPFTIAPLVSFVPPGDAPLAAALYLLPQIWPTLIDELTDPTDKLIVRVVKDIVPYGTALPPGYAEMQALNKWRSIQMVSSIDLHNLPPVERYLTTQHVSLPHQLTAVLPVWSTSTAHSESSNATGLTGSVSSSAEISGSILVLKKGGFQGAAVARVERVHFYGIPPDSAMPECTIIRPSSGTAFIKGGSNSNKQDGATLGAMLNINGQPAHGHDVIGYTWDGYPMYYDEIQGGPGQHATGAATSISSHLQIVDINDVLTAGINTASVNGVTQGSNLPVPVTGGTINYQPGLDVTSQVTGTFGVTMPPSCPASIPKGMLILQEVNLEKRRFNLYVRTIVYVIAPGECEAVGSGAGST